MGNVYDWSTNSEISSSSEDSYEIRSYSSHSRNSRGSGRGKSARSKKKKKGRFSDLQKTRITAICCLLAIFATCLFSYFYLRTIPKVTKGDIDIHVTVVYENGEKDEFSINTAEKFLGDALVAYGIATSDDHDIGTYKTINDITVQSGASWVFTRDGAPLSLSVNQTPIETGESYVITYTPAGK